MLALPVYILGRKRIIWTIFLVPSLHNEAAVKLVQHSPERSDVVQRNTSPLQVANLCICNTSLPLDSITVQLWYGACCWGTADPCMDSLTNCDKYLTVTITNCDKYLKMKIASNKLKMEWFHQNWWQHPNNNRFAGEIPNERSYPSAKM